MTQPKGFRIGIIGHGDGRKSGIINALMEFQSEQMEPKCADRVTKLKEQSDREKLIESIKYAIMLMGRVEITDGRTAMAYTNLRETLKEIGVEVDG